MRLAEPALKHNVRPPFAALAGETRIALAVSGGSDSMAMLRLAVDWAGALPVPPELHVLTVDHGLRPGSAEEARLVGRWCADLPVVHHILPWAGAKPATGIQAKARQARYDLMTQWCLAHGVRSLLTGHTLDDQAETVLMRQRRTDTAESLAGIWEKTCWNGVVVQRPLLGQRRADLKTYLAGIKQDWIDDPSNLDPKFERVRLRQELADDEGRMADLAAIARGAADETRALAEAALSWNTQHLSCHEAGYGSFSRAAFRLIDKNLQRRVLRQLIMVFGGSSQADPPALSHLAGWLSGPAISRRTLGGAVVAARCSSIAIGREAGRIAEASVIVPDSGEVRWDDRFLVSAPAGLQVVAAGSIGKTLPRSALPSFVARALPALMQGNELVCVPQLTPEPGFSAKFIRCLR